MLSGFELSVGRVFIESFLINSVDFESYFTIELLSINDVIDRKKKIGK